MDELRLSGYREPLGLFVRRATRPDGYEDLRARTFELSSRGDRVHGRLLLPDSGRGPFPVVLLQHGIGGSSEAPYLLATAGPWARRGVAVASIDFPLHGVRADAKLAEAVVRTLDYADADARSCALLIEFVRQCVIDLERTVDALAELDYLDGERLAYAGFSLGAMVGAAFCALDARPRAAALALAGGGRGPAGVDPARYVGRIAPRPVLLVNGERDTRVPRESALALLEAAGDPVEQLWFDAPHESLPGVALKAMWTFLARALEVDPQA